jgi:hypothetical protein
MSSNPDKQRSSEDMPDPAEDQPQNPDELLTELIATLDHNIDDVQSAAIVQTAAEQSSAINETYVLRFRHGTSLEFSPGLLHNLSELTFDDVTHYFLQHRPEVLRLQPEASIENVHAATSAVNSQTSIAIQVLSTDIVDDRFSTSSHDDDSRYLPRPTQYPAAPASSSSKSGSDNDGLLHPRPTNPAAPASSSGKSGSDVDRLGYRHARSLPNVSSYAAQDYLRTVFDPQSPSNSRSKSRSKSRTQTPSEQVQEAETVQPRLRTQSLPTNPFARADLARYVQEHGHEAGALGTHWAHIMSEAGFDLNALQEGEQRRQDDSWRLIDKQITQEIANKAALLKRRTQFEQNRDKRGGTTIDPDSLAKAMERYQEESTAVPASAEQDVRTATPVELDRTQNSSDHSDHHADSSFCLPWNWNWCQLSSSATQRGRTGNPQNSSTQDSRRR